MSIRTFLSAITTISVHAGLSDWYINTYSKRIIIAFPPLTGVPDGTPVFENSKNYISGAIVTKGQIKTAAF